MTDIAAALLIVSTDNPEYKNSIITVVGESEKRFAQRLEVVNFVATTRRWY